MNDSLIANLLWGAGFLLNAVLLFVLVYKRRYQTVPWFTAWMAWEVISSIAAFVGYRFCSHHTYSMIYWSCDFTDVLLQIAVVLEIARYVLKRSGRWVEGARIRLTLMAATAPLVAFLMAWLMKPAADTRLDAWEARSSLFTTILVFLLFTAVVIASQQLALGMRTHVMRECYGFIVWNIIAFTTDTLHAYWATLGHFTLLENIRIAVFQICLIYWGVSFWLPEPALAPITEKTKIRLDDLASRLEYAQSPRASTTGVLPK